MIPEVSPPTNADAIASLVLKLEKDAMISDTAAAQLSARVNEIEEELRVLAEMRKQASEAHTTPPTRFFERLDELLEPYKPEPIIGEEPPEERA